MSTVNAESQDVYMLPRGGKESERLNQQHGVIKTIFGGQLVSPSVPVNRLRAIADVGTGTGVWLRDLADTFYPNASDRSSREFIGFDISNQQFPDPVPAGFRFEVQDVTKPFPPEFHGTFDIVHIRFLTFALKETDLESTIANVIQILRPGGYIHWTEVDLIDCYAVPDSPKLRQLVEYIGEERANKGLTAAADGNNLASIFPKLVALISSMKPSIPSGHVNSLTWGPELLRLVDVTMAESQKSDSLEMQNHWKTNISATSGHFLGTMLESHKKLVDDPSIHGPEKEELKKKLESIAALLADVQSPDGEFQTSKWFIDPTRIVARKAIYSKSDDSWMRARNPEAYE